MILKRVFVATALVFSSIACAQDINIDWTWKKEHYCNDTSPALMVSGVPVGTQKLQFQMNDLDFNNFNHGGGTVDYTGDGGKMTVPDGALKEFKGPCPRQHFNNFGHDYVIAVKALAADGAVLGTGSKKQNFSSKTAK